jgi:signal transduction histidine kinase
LILGLRRAMKIHTFYIIIAFGLVDYTPTQAQSSATLDSLAKLVITVKDSQKVNLLNQLSDAYANTDVTQSIDYSQEALVLAEKLAFAKGISQSYWRLAQRHWDIADYPKALHYAYECLKVSQKNRDQAQIADAWNIIGIINNAQGNTQSAIKNFEKSLKIHETIGNSVGQAKVLNNIGEVYKEKKEYNQALKYYFQALRINDNVNFNPGRGVCLNNIGEVYLAQKNFAQALEHFVKSLKIKSLTNNKRSQANTLNNLAITYQKIREYPNALRHAQIALETATQGKALADRVRANQILSEIYGEIQDFEKAYQYQLTYNQLHDSLFSKERAEKINDLQTRYETQKREQKIEILQTKRERDQLIIGLVSLALLLALGAGFFFFQIMTYRKQKNRVIVQQNRELREAKEEVRQTNEELLAVNANLENIVKDRTLTIRQTNQELNLANRELDIFIYRASHDFKAPYASLMGLLNLARLLTEDDTLLDLLNRMENTVIKGDRMLSKMLMMNTINHKTGKNYQNFQLIDFQAVITETIAQIPTQITEQEEIEYQIEIASNISYISDNDLITIILQNLIENAIYYSFEHREAKSIIRINVEYLAENVQITVWDNGIGIAEDYQKEIFKMFFRGSEFSKGNGLGLFVVKRAVEKLQGKIDVDSKLNVYTCFTITLPQLVAQTDVSITA